MWCMDEEIMDQSNWSTRKPIRLNLSGTTFDTAEPVFGEAVIVHDKANPHDGKALSVQQDGKHIGWIPSKAVLRRLADEITELRRSIVSMGRPSNPAAQQALASLYDEKARLEEKSGNIVLIRDRWEKAQVKVVEFATGGKKPFVAIEVGFE